MSKVKNIKIENGEYLIEIESVELNILQVDEIFGEKETDKMIRKYLEGK